MNTHNIPFSNKKENPTELSEICSYWFCSKRFKEEFEIAMVNRSSVCKPLKFYCISILDA